MPALLSSWIFSLHCGAACWALTPCAEGLAAALRAARRPGRAMGPKWALPLRLQLPLPLAVPLRLRLPWLLPLPLPLSLLLLGAALALGPRPAAGAHWAQATELHPNFAVFWSPNEEDITFELQVRTLGYVGFGFSADGTMTDADMVIGWVYKDKVFLQDRHARGHAEPELDTTSNYELLLGYENGTHTVLRFRRRYYTCDPDDFPITNDTMRLLFAYHNDEPSSESEPLPYHGSAHRGARSMSLLQRSAPRQPLPTDLMVWELRNPPVTLVAGEDTLCWCKIFKLPNLRRKHHMVRYEPLHEADSRRYMHHVVVYECAGDGRMENPELEVHARDAGQPCYQPNLPDIYNNCNGVVVAWARGSEGFSFPAEAGYPMDPDRGPRYFKMETHFVNPGGDTDLTDGAGMRLYHTAALRPHDAGVLSVGLDPNWRHIIPPGQPEVLSQGHCISQCTRHGLRDTSINVFAVILHTHLIGRKVHLRHIRDGQELPPIAGDNNYDYNYQEYRRLQKPVKVYPGDHLMTDCVYNSMGRTTITLGGLTTREEMCLAYALYFPRVDLALCHSLPSLPTVLHSLGIQELWQGSSPVMIKAPPELAEMTLENRLVTYDWEKNFRMFEETTRRGSFQPRCALKQMQVLSGTENMEAFYPNVTRPYKEPSACPSGRLKKPRRRKKPGTADYDGEGEDGLEGEDAADGAHNVLDGDPSDGAGAGGGAGADPDKTKVYSSSMGVQESSRLNGAPRGPPAARAALAAAAALLLLLRAR